VIVTLIFKIRPRKFPAPGPMASRVSSGVCGPYEAAGFLCEAGFGWCSYRLIARLSPLSIPTDTGGTSACWNRKVIDVMNALPERTLGTCAALRTWCGFKQASIEFERGARAAGVPKLLTASS